MEREHDGTWFQMSMERDPHHGNHTWPLDENPRPKIQLKEEKQKEERRDDGFNYLFYLYYFRTFLVLHLGKTCAN
jgi:hypothetical protein